MNPDEIRKMLPAYRAQTLSDAEREAVEEALRAHPGLADELDVWGPEPTKPPDPISAELPEPVLTEAPGVAEVNIESFADGLKTLRRPVVAIPAAALLIGIALFLLLRSPSPPGERTLYLPYSRQSSAPGSGPTPELLVDGSARRVIMTVTIPHSLTPYKRFSIAIRSPFGAPVQMTNAASSAGEAFDTLKSPVDATVFGMEGQYSVAVRELPASVLKGSRPEEYFYIFRVRFPAKQ